MPQHQGRDCSYPTPLQIVLHFHSNYLGLKSERLSVPHSLLGVTGLADSSLLLWRALGVQDPSFVSPGHLWALHSSHCVRALPYQGRDPLSASNTGASSFPGLGDNSSKQGAEDEEDLGTRNQGPLEKGVVQEDLGGE